MSAHGWVVVAYLLVFAALAVFLFYGENLEDWWRRYRSYRKVVSDEYSRHDGTQTLRHPRRYYSQPNDAPPSFPAVVMNYWFAQTVDVPVEPVKPARHLAIVA